MKKVITFSLIVLLSSPMFVGCKSGTSCFTKNGSRVPTSTIASSSYDSDDASATGAPRVVNAFPSGEVVMMNTTSASSQCAPCTPACGACDPCSPSQGGVSASGYPGM